MKKNDDLVGTSAATVAAGNSDRSKLHNPLKNLSRFEWVLWISSLAALLITFIAGGQHNPVIITATLIGVTGLIFIARGDAWGQICTIVFSILYSIVSVSFMYYGEFITYAFMTLPMAVISLISWRKMKKRQLNGVSSKQP